MALASCEISWLVNLLTEFQVPQQTVLLFFYSTSAIHIANNSVFDERTKHIKRDCNTTQEWIESGLLKTLHIQTVY